MANPRTSALPVQTLRKIRRVAQCVRNKLVLRIILLTSALLVSGYAISHWIQRQHAVLVLHSGFPLILSAEDTYPNVLEHDVSGKISPKLHHDVATRFNCHAGNNQKSPFKLLSVAQRKPSCLSLIKGQPEEIAYSQQFMEESKPLRLPLLMFAKAPLDCEGFIKTRGYITHSLEEERNFPLAYSIMMYRDADQAERLLRSIYRPHNYYCIHVDAKADKELQDAMRGISECFPNVWLSSKQNIVDWAQFNSLEPWMFCMQDLWKFSWKYFINLTGQEFPLKTNLQIVKILKALNGSNIVDVTTYKHSSWRWYNNFPPPFKITPYKGLVFIVASRGFVDYILHSTVAKQFLEWVSHTDFPDETYFPSLNHNPHLMVPGSYKGNPETHALEKPYIARFVNWGEGWEDGKLRYPFYWPCGGKRVRGVCIFGVKDLQLLTNRKELFANKFMMDFEPLSLDCLEEWHFNMTLLEYAGTISMDTTWYENLAIVKNKVL